MIRWCNNGIELVEFLALVSTCAPDDFPQEGGDEPLDLKRAFEDFRFGLDAARSEIADPLVVEQCQALLDEADDSYSIGEENAGASKLQEVERLVERAINHAVQ